MSLGSRWGEGPDGGGSATLSIQVTQSRARGGTEVTEEEWDWLCDLCASLVCSLCNNSDFGWSELRGDAAPHRHAAVRFFAGLRGAERGDEGGGVGGFHEGFADEDGMGAAAADAGGVGGGPDAAFADGDDVLGETRDEAFAEAEVGLEDGEVAVVDADEVGAVGDGAVELGLVVNLKQSVEAGGGGGGVEVADLGIGEGAHDDEDGAGAGLAGLEDLDGVDHEVLAQGGDGGRVGAEAGGHGDEVVEGAAEVFFVGENGEAVGAGGAVAAGLVGGGDAGGDGAGGGGAAFDLGDDAEGAIGAAEGGAEGGGRGQAGVERGEFLEGDGAHLPGYFEALPRHDFGEFIGHRLGSRNTGGQGFRGRRWSSEFGDRSSEIGVRRWEMGVRRSEIGVWSSEFGVWRWEIGERRAESRSSRNELRGRSHAEGLRGE